MAKTKGGGDKESINSHGGFRPGAGRKPAQYPAFLKKLRATGWERAELMSYLTGDARKDFEIIMKALKAVVS